MPDLAELIGRVSRADARDNRLNGDLALCLGLFKPDRACHRGVELCADRWYRRDSFTIEYEAPNLTGSLDAALALVEAKLPDQHWSVQSIGLREEGRFEAEIWVPQPIEFIGAVRSHRRPSPQSVEGRLPRHARSSGGKRP